MTRIKFRGCDLSPSDRKESQGTPSGLCKLATLFRSDPLLHLGLQAIQGSRHHTVIRVLLQRLKQRPGF